MNKSQVASLVVGAALILLGLFFLVVQLIPGLRQLLDPGFWWPVVVIAGGVFFLLMGMATATPALVVPASVFAGIGVLLFWQNATGRWGTWAYAWALIPGFVGIGLVLLGLVSSKERQSIAAGLWLMFISAVMFVVFGTLMGGFRGPWRQLVSYWPLLLIAGGIVTLVQVMFRPRS